MSEESKEKKEKKEKKFRAEFSPGGVNLTKTAFSSKRGGEITPCKKKVSVVIPAGGSGSRMQLEQAKQYLKIKNKMVLEYTLEAFNDHPAVSEIILVLPQVDLEQKPLEFWHSLGFDKVRFCAAGGDTRQESVWNGLKRVDKKSGYVLIHDAARCLFNSDDLDEAVSQCADLDGIIYAHPVSDSIKQVQLRLIEKSADRSKLWAMETPQIFKREFIIDAYEKASRDQFFATDDAQVAEYKKGKIMVFPSKHINLKLTQASDISLFEALLDLKEKSYV